MNAQTVDLPLFRPPAPAIEQRQLGDQNFERWLETSDGKKGFAVFCAELLRQARVGERVSGKLAWEIARCQTRTIMNNNYHALAVREAERLHPELAGKAEKRKRTARL